MKKIFLVNDEIKLVTNNKVISEKLDNIIEKGMIVQKDKFMEEFLKIIAKEKIKGKFLGDSIIIVKNTFYNSRDLFYLESIFSELGFVKVIFKDIKDFFDIKATYVEVEDKYLVINWNKGLFLDLDYFKDMNMILDEFKDMMEEKVVLFGSNKDIPSIKISDKSIYYYENYDTFIVDSLLKINKSDG
ncbi:MAG: hypothetical protein NC483_03825 [Ruminococcus sp.]|nr:hypothetical protein [Ruminococcus sp.]